MRKVISFLILLKKGVLWDMKKSMTILLCTISVLVSLVFGMTAKYNDYLKIDNIGKTEFNFDFYINESTISADSLLNEFSEISKQYDASIIRTDIIDENNKSVTYKSGVFTDTYFEKNNFNLQSGRTPKKKNEFISTFKTNDSNQVGIIKDIFDDDPLIICSLESYFNKYTENVTGSYFVCCNEKDKESILQNLSVFLGISQTDLLKSNFTKTYSQGPVEILIIACFILLMIYTLMCLFYPTSQTKIIGIYKLVGYKLRDIWGCLNNSILVVDVIFIFASLIIQKILIPSLDFAYLTKLLGIQFIMLLINIILSWTMMLIIKKYTLSSILKGFFHVRLPLLLSYLLKVVTFVAIVLILSPLSDVLQTTMLTYAAASAYEKESKYMTISQYDYIDDEFQQTINGNSTLKVKVYNMFKELEKTSDAEYIKSYYFDNEYLNSFAKNIPLKREIKSNEEYFLLGTNLNGMKRYKGLFNDSVNKYFEGDDLTVLAPKKYKNNTDFKYVCDILQWLYKDSNAKLNVQFYNNNDRYIFTQNVQMIGANHALVKNPIYVCLHDQYLEHESYSFLDSAISNPIRVENTKANRQNIRRAIVNNKLEYNKVKFGSINVDYKGYMKTTIMGTFILVMGLTLIVIVDILASYYIILIVLVSRKKQIFVKKMLGFSVLDRYKNEIFYFITFYIFGFVQLLLIKPNKYSALIYMILVGIDIFISYAMIKCKERKQLNGMLKGEE